MSTSRIRMANQLGIQKCSIEATHIYQLPFIFLKPKKKSVISRVPHAQHISRTEIKWNSYQEVTSAFQLIIACFPDTSESFNSKSLETLPRVSGSLEALVGCTEQQSPQEGPEMTSRERQLPALLTEKYDKKFFTFGKIKEHPKKCPLSHK